MLKAMHRIFAAVTVICLCITVVPTSAFAVEDSLAAEVVATTDTKADSNGNTVVTITVERNLGDTEDVTAASYVDEGVENKEWDEEVKPGEQMPDIKVELKPGETTSNSDTQTTTEITGDEQQGANDENYDYTETVITIDRSVTAESTETEVIIERVDTELDSIQAEDYKGKDPNVFGPDHDFVAGTADTIPQPEEEGFDYQLVGYGDATNELKVLRDYVTYKKVDGVPVTDEDGNYIIEKIETKLDNTPMQIALRKDENGEYEYFFGYCIDADTETQDGAWYKVANLEDNDYYPNPDSAGKIRAIVTNGYWGTESGKGSISQIKELMKKTYGADEEITVDADDKGGKATFKIADIIDSLTEAEALAAMQAAIWSFANGESNTRDGQDGYIAHGPVNVYKPNPNRNSYVREYLPESDARAMAVYNWLRSLEPVANTSKGVSTVINDKNAVKNMTLIVQDKAEDYAQNMDADRDNDVYNVELSFSLAIVPDPEKDDLLVYLLDEEGNTIRDKDGEPIIRRLAGENSEERTADSIHPDENGVYTLTGLQLSENSDFKFDLHLEGAQYLEEGVYIYTAHGGSDKSQSIVGIAEGTHTVDASMEMTIRFDADENKHVSAKHVWHSESEENPMPPKHDHPVMEEISLAKPVKTGDASYTLMSMAIIGAIGLAVSCLLAGKVRKN